MNQDEGIVRREAAFTNDGPETVVLVVEPWGMELPIEPGRCLHVHAESTEAGELEIERGEGFVVAWLWAGCHVRVLDGDKEVYSTHGRPPFPSVGGMSIQQFIKTVFPVPLRRKSADED